MTQSYWQTCGLGCVMEAAYIPFFLFTAIVVYLMSKALTRNVSLGLILVTGILPWALGLVGRQMTLEKIEQAQRAASSGTPTIPVAYDSSFLWYIPIGTTILMILFWIMVWRRAPNASNKVQ